MARYTAADDTVEKLLPEQRSHVLKTEPPRSLVAYAPAFAFTAAAASCTCHSLTFASCTDCRRNLCYFCPLLAVRRANSAGGTVMSAIHRASGLLLWQPCRLARIRQPDVPVKSADCMAFVMQAMQWV